MSKRGPSLLGFADAPPGEGEGPPPPPPWDPKVPLTFDEIWFNADDEIEDEEERNHAKELKALIIVRLRRFGNTLSILIIFIRCPHTRNKNALWYEVWEIVRSQWIDILRGVGRSAALIGSLVRSYLSMFQEDAVCFQEESLMVAIILQALQHMVVDRPNDPFRFLARFIRVEGPKISDQIERAKRIAAARQAARDKAKRYADEADRLAREAAEAAKLAPAEAAKTAAILKLQQQAAEAAEAAAVTTDAIEIPIPKAGKKKKEPEKPAKAGPKKPEWQK